MRDRQETTETGRLKSPICASDETGWSGGGIWRMRPALDMPLPWRHNVGELWLSGWDESHWQFGTTTIFDCMGCIGLLSTQQKRKKISPVRGLTVDSSWVAFKHLWPWPWPWIGSYSIPRASLTDLYLRTKFHWNRKKNFLWTDGRFRPTRRSRPKKWAPMPW